MGLRQKFGPHRIFSPPPSPSLSDMLSSRGGGILFAEAENIFIFQIVESEREREQPVQHSLLNWSSWANTTYFQQYGCPTSLFYQFIRL